MSFLRRPMAIVAAIAVVSLTFCWPGSAFSQSITLVGSAETFDVATWNIEWFGNTGSGNGPSDVDQQRENVEKVIRESGIDLWALQEISDTRQFQKLLDSLGGPWDGMRAIISGTQRIAFIYNTDVVQVRQFKHILESFSTGPAADQNYFAGRPPLQLQIDVMLADTTVRLTVITLHMKCCTDLLSYQRRTNASNRLKIHIDFTSLASESVIIAGDFNDELVSSIRLGNPSPYDNFSNDPGNFLFPTLPLDQQNINTFCFFNSPTCSRGSTIDHLLITDELFAHYETGSAARLQSVLTEIPNYVNTTSDHMPVYARFVFPTNTGTESMSEIPERLSIRDLYPNPVRDQLEFTIETLATANVLVEVYDLLGRKQWSESISPTYAGVLRARIDTHGLPAGVYFLRVSTPSYARQVKFVRIAR